MRLWAYGTSPHGLALSSDHLWSLTAREFYALEDVQQAPARRWAAQCALMVNINLKESAEPYTADDFLGTGNRDARIAERMRGQHEAMILNKKLAMINRGSPMPSGIEVPDWARADYGG